MREIVISWGRAGHMAELVDALVSGTSGATLGSSSLLMPTTNFCYRARSARLEKFSAAAECAKRTKTGDKNLKQFWGCSSVDRALRSHRRGRGFESHQLHQAVLGGAKSRQMDIKKQKSWGYGGMVDAEDLKSFDHCDRVGSSPTIPTKT